MSPSGRKRLFLKALTVHTTRAILVFAVLCAVPHLALSLSLKEDLVLWNANVTSILYYSLISHNFLRFTALCFQQPGVQIISLPY